MAFGSVNYTVVISLNVSWIVTAAEEQNNVIESQSVLDSGG